MIKKLQIKFVVINMTVVIFMLGIIFSTIFYFTKFNLEDDSVNFLHDIASMPIQANKPGNQKDKIQLPYYSIELAKSGEIISLSGGYFDLTDKKHLKTIVESSLTSPREIGVLNDYNLRYYRISTPLKDVVIFADITGEISTMDNLMKNCLIIGAISLVLFFILSLWLSRWVVKPIEVAWNQQRRFVSDASHDLKTPLTVILTSAGMIKSHQCNPNLIPKLNDNIITVSTQMRELVDGLLTLAKSDEGIPKGERQKIDFANIVIGSCLSMEPVYYDNNLSLSYDVKEPCFVLGNELLLRQVVEIILDNAVKYSVLKGSTTVTMSSNLSHHMLSISNEGSPITQEQLGRIFDRFYRIDEARTDSNGHGLGLSIAQNIIKSHDGGIWAESNDGVNTIFIKIRRI